MHRQAISFVLALLAAAVFGSISLAADARDAPAKSAPVTTIAAAAMPKQGQETLALIRRGGPYPYAKDGTVFGNRERVLPNHPRGHYKEFTVKTPGSRDRGARRIVCGGDIRNQAASVCYYTDDHYATFKRIKE